MSIDVCERCRTCCLIELLKLCVTVWAKHCRYSCSQQCSPPALSRHVWHLVFTNAIWGYNANSQVARPSTCIFKLFNSKWLLPGTIQGRHVFVSDHPAVFCETDFHTSNKNPGVGLLRAALEWTRKSPPPAGPRKYQYRLSMRTASPRHVRFAGSMLTSVSICLSFTCLQRFDNFKDSCAWLVLKNLEAGGGACVSMFCNANHIHTCDECAIGMNL